MTSVKSTCQNSFYASLFIFMRLVFPKQCNSALYLDSLLKSCCHFFLQSPPSWRDKRIKRCRIKGERVTHMYANCFCVVLIYEAYHVLFMIPLRHNSEWSYLCVSELPLNWFNDASLWLLHYITGLMKFRALFWILHWCYLNLKAL